jgi:hypothetical protein
VARAVGKFKWKRGNNRWKSEEAESPLLARLFADALELESVKLIDIRSGVKLSYEVLVPIGDRVIARTYNGHSDHLVVPDVAANDKTFSFPSGLMLIDWKRRDRFRDAVPIRSIALLQLLAFELKGRRSVPVVMTDMETGMRIWRRDGDLIEEYTYGSEIWLPLDVGMCIVRHLLMQMRNEYDTRIAALRKKPLSTTMSDSNEETSHSAPENGPSSSKSGPSSASMPLDPEMQNSDNAADKAFRMQELSMKSCRTPFASLMSTLNRVL